VPSAGDRFDAVSDDKTARRVAEHRTIKAREAERQKTPRTSLEDFLKKPKIDEGHELRVVVKADVDGSVEALSHALRSLSTRKVTVSIVHAGVGTVTENDVNLAVASQAMIVGFNSRPDAKAHALAQQQKVDVWVFSIIYDMLDEVRRAMAALLAPKLEEKAVGRAEVRALFTVPKIGMVAGCYVSEGKVTRTSRVRVMRAQALLHDSTVASLRRFKDDAREVAVGYECGIGVLGFAEYQVGDVLELYEIQQVVAELDDAIVDLSHVDTGASSAPTGAGAPA
jgi:translation initiation factor IF-2